MWTTSTSTSSTTVINFRTVRIVQLRKMQCEAMGVCSLCSFSTSPLFFLLPSFPHCAHGYIQKVKNKRALLFLSYPSLSVCFHWGRFVFGQSLFGNPAPFFFLLCICLSATLFCSCKFPTFSFVKKEAEIQNRLISPQSFFLGWRFPFFSSLYYRTAGEEKRRGIMGH